MIKVIKTIQQPRVPSGNGEASGFSKGTSCVLIEDGGSTYVEKTWHFGDWLFGGEYEYNVEKHIYQEANARGLSVPQLLDFDDTDRKLRIEYVSGERVATPCLETYLLESALEFYDEFKTICFPKTRPLYTMDGAHMHDYRLDQLKHSKSYRAIWDQVDSMYESFLSDIPHYTVPFDQIVKNSFVCDRQLVFIDFEWTIAGPHEFTLARLAVEFNAYDDTRILSRVECNDLYYFFLLHFYHYGREPQQIYGYLRRRLPEGQLRKFQDMITEAAYVDESWAST